MPHLPYHESASFLSLINTCLVSQVGLILTHHWHYLAVSISFPYIILPANHSIDDFEISIKTNNSYAADSGTASGCSGTAKRRQGSGPMGRTASGPRTQVLCASCVVPEHAEACPGSSAYESWLSGCWFSKTCLSSAAESNIAQIQLKGLKPTVIWKKAPMIVFISKKSECEQ